MKTNKLLRFLPVCYSLLLCASLPWNLKMFFAMSCPPSLTGDHGQVLTTALGKSVECGSANRAKVRKRKQPTSVAIDWTTAAVAMEPTFRWLQPVAQMMPDCKTECTEEEQRCLDCSDLPIQMAPVLGFHEDPQDQEQQAQKSRRIGT